MYNSKKIERWIYIDVVITMDPAVGWAPSQVASYLARTVTGRSEVLLRFNMWRTFSTHDKTSFSESHKQLYIAQASSEHIQHLRFPSGSYTVLQRFVVACQEWDASPCTLLIEWSWLSERRRSLGSRIIRRVPVSWSNLKAVWLNNVLALFWGSFCSTWTCSAHSI